MLRKREEEVAKVWGGEDAVDGTREGWRKFACVRSREWKSLKRTKSEDEGESVERGRIEKLRI